MLWLARFPPWACDQTSSAGRKRQDHPGHPATLRCLNDDEYLRQEREGRFRSCNEVAGDRFVHQLCTATGSRQSERGKLTCVGSSTYVPQWPRSSEDRAAVS